MFRKLSLALAVSAALSSTGVFALGLGEISTKSALNESFNADIELVSVGQGELDGIKVTLAPPVDFARRGLDRPFLLSKLRFRPVELDDGRQVIQVTTHDPVREPFLNFLVEVNWPKGRLVREFTVLLDPPVTAAPRPAPVLPVVSAPAMAAPEPELVRYRAPERSPVPQRTLTEERYVPAPAAPQPSMATSGRYGPVPKGATLWSIARELGIPGATTEQLVMALFRANPGAFAGNNVNNLLAGAILRIPTQEGILSQSPREARSSFRAQAQNWTGPQGGAVVPAERAEPAEPADRLEIAAAPEEEVPGSDMERVKTDLMLVRETGESTRQETLELRSRIRELEAQLADIRQLLKLKSDQLATLQAGQKETTEAEPTSEMPEPVAEVVTEPPEPVVEVEAEPAEAIELPQPEEATASLPSEVAEPEPDTAASIEPVVEPAVEPTAAPIAEPMAEPPVAVEQTPPAQPAPQPEKAATPPPPKAVLAKVAPEPPPEPGVMDQLLANPTMLAIGGGVLVLLLGLGGLLLKRRRDTEDQFDESVLLAPNESTTVELDKEPEIVEAVEHEEETSFISDFSPSDIDALQEETGEVDPAAEADVYIAYGRYQQAESLINQAVEKAPERLDLKLKLLEIYFTTRNVSSFTGLAEQLDSDGAPDEDPQLWSRVQSMGRELVPGHDLFASVGAVEEEMAPESAMGGGEEDMLVTDSEQLVGLDLDLDTELSELQEEPPPAATVVKTEPVLEPLAMPESEFSEGQGPQSGTLVHDEEEDSEFAIDLSDLDTLEDIDLGDLGMDSEEVAEGDVSEQAMAAEPKEEVESPQEELTSASMAEPESMLDESEFELSQFDLGGSEASDLEVSEVVPEAEMLGPSDEEDAGTKLDLARAYLEMGDAEGASEFLEEVLEEGDDVQKAAAKELMEKLG